MRWGIFSDIHSNLEALKAVLKAYHGEGIDTYLFLGDVVGYGADPGACIQLLDDISCIVIAGNHDWAVAGLLPLTYFNIRAKQALQWTGKNIEDSQLRFLSSLPLTFENDDFYATHSTVHEPQQFHYMTDSCSAGRSFSCLRQNICFLGHTHFPGVFIRNKQADVYYQNTTQFHIRGGYRYIVNVGSVGQPRDDNNRARYCIYDTEKQEVIIKAVAYDIKTAQKKIISKGLPHFFATRLIYGR